MANIKGAGLNYTYKVDLSRLAEVDSLADVITKDHDQLDVMINNAGVMRVPISAYAQSKLALTMWNNALAASYGSEGPVFVAVNPGSLLASKMVKEVFGVTGKSLSIGANVLARAALSDEFADASGHYFDNDKRRFAPPHPDALNNQRCAAVLATIEELVDPEKS